MSKERELLEEALVVLEMVHMDECDLYFAIEELLAQPKKELKREPLGDDVIRKFADAFGYMVYNNAFTQGVRWAEKQHRIGVDDE